tara:strand:- start:4306 stop:5187 length:882 start_codon:yes stop_codon:yes gene_type:complete
MYWIKKYKPKSLDELTYNKNTVQYLKTIIEKKEFMHFVLCGPSGSGKRTLIRLFLEEVTTPNNVMWINQSCLKTIESREKLYTFIDSKSSCLTCEKKWLIVENLNKMVVNFSNILFNILSSDDIYVCILETEPTNQVAPWCVSFNTSSHTTDELVQTGINILKNENFENIDMQLLQRCAEISKNKIYTFLFLIQNIFNNQCDISPFMSPNFAYEVLLFHPSLKKRIKQLLQYEIVGYSHLDIAIHLYNYIFHESKNIEYAIIIGKSVAHLTLYEHDNYQIYALICKLWELSYK